jgi:hypothetical protein
MPFNERGEIIREDRNRNRENNPSNRQNDVSGNYRIANPTTTNRADRTLRNIAIVIISFVFLYFLGSFIFSSSSSTPQRNSPARTYVNPNAINKTGFVSAKQQANIRNGNSKNAQVLSTLNRGSSVYVIERDPKTGWYRIKYGNNNYGYISNKLITFDKNTLKTYHGSFYKSFDNGSRISLTKDTEAQILKTLSELNQYSDKFEVLTYDYINQPSAARWRGKEVLQLAFKTKMAESIDFIDMKFPKNYKNRSNVVVIRSKGVNKNPSNYTEPAKPEPNYDTSNTNSIIAVSKIRSSKHAFLGVQRILNNGVLVDADLDNLFRKELGMSVTNTNLERLGFYQLPRSSKFKYEFSSSNLSQQEIYERIIISKAKKKLKSYSNNLVSLPNSQYLISEWEIVNENSFYNFSSNGKGWYGNKKFPQEFKWSLSDNNKVINVQMNYQSYVWKWQVQSMNNNEIKIYSTKDNISRVLKKSTLINEIKFHKQNFFGGWKNPKSTLVLTLRNNGTGQYGWPNSLKNGSWYLSNDNTRLNFKYNNVVVYWTIVSVNNNNLVLTSDGKNRIILNKAETNNKAGVNNKSAFERMQ